jgi:hypothetical protein
MSEPIPSVWSDDQRRLLEIAKLVEAEAVTWAEGWQNSDGFWEPHDEWAHVRYQKLHNASEWLVSLANRRTKKQIS